MKSKIGRVYYPNITAFFLLFFFFNLCSYNKFIRSKDLSSKSAEDMACVFGQRSKSEPVTPQELSEVGSRMLNCYPLSVFLKASQRAKAT